MVTRLPRLLIAAPASGGGKSTVATGLMAALRAESLKVAPFKVGPDHVDPCFHTLATGRPGRNLDPVLCGEALLEPLLLHGSRTPAPADIAVIEGVMGLFDGQLGTGGRGSSAHVAAATGTPVVLVIDCSRASRTHAAVALGLASFDPRVPVHAVILNKVASSRHETEISTELTQLGMRVVGAIPRRAGIELPGEHPGLTGTEPGLAELVTELGVLVSAHVDLSAVHEVAGSAGDLTGEAWNPADHVTAMAATPRIALAGGGPFPYSYPETRQLLEAAGCEVVLIDPLRDDALPPYTAGLVLGGGFPTTQVTAVNPTLLGAIAKFAAAGGPVVAEGAGLLWLASSFEGQNMADLVPAAGTRARLSLGYRRATALTDTLIAREGEQVTGHEYQRSALTSHPGAEFPAAWELDLPDGVRRLDGASLAFAGATPTLYASHLQVHWAAHPQAAQRLAEAAARFEPLATEPTPPTAPATPDLTHHGDSDLADGLIDFAVNVAVTEPPEWLSDRIVAGVPSWAAYPDDAPARHALASFHGLPEEYLLPTAGAAEAFTLIARGLSPRHALVVHPQFTEPEWALRTAGHRVDHLLLRAEDNFQLDPAAVPESADLVVIGNPTNPTGALHPKASLRALRRPGRVLVVDEAFIDLTDESESLIGADMTGVLVLRSLTKTYGLAGLRVGYAVGDPTLIAALATQQPPWSVSTPAVDAIVACCGPEAAEHTTALRASLPARRHELVTLLHGIGLDPVASQAPFVLVETSSIDPHRSIRAAMARRGIAVRRGETFPGLGPTWIRLAVRDTPLHTQLIAALTDLDRKSR